MAIQNPTSNYNWTLPTVGGSADAWGTILNAIIGDDSTGIDAVVKAVSDVANAALPKAGGTVTGEVTFNVTPRTNAIAERTSGSGVTVDGLLIKDGAIPESGVPNLAASKITSGTFDVARIPNLAASKITAGTFGAGNYVFPGAVDLTGGDMRFGQAGDTGSRAIRFMRDVTGTAIGGVIETSAAGVAQTAMQFRGSRIDVLRDFSIPSGSRVYLDGGSDTYIVESSANTIKFFTGGVSALELTENANLILQATKRLFLDGGGNTYITEGAADRIDLIAGGTSALRLSATTATFAGDATLAATKRLYLDGGGDTFIYEPTADRITFFAGGSNVFTINHSGLVRTFLPFMPAVGDTLDLGGSSLRWANIYGVAGNFSGLITAAGGITATGTVSATTFSGSGAGLTSIPAEQLTGTVANARISGAYTGFTNITASGDINAGTVKVGTLDIDGISITAASLISGPKLRLTINGTSYDIDLTSSS